MPLPPPVVVAPRLRRHVAPALARQLSRRIGRAARRMGVKDDELATLGVRLIDGEEMARLHWTFMHERGATDVLSFPGVASLEAAGFPIACDCADHEDASDHHHTWLADEGVSESQEFAHDAWLANGVAAGFGDVALCWPVILAQARARDSQAILHAATILAVHGLAHLLGHDHRTSRQARAMHRLELVGLRVLGLPDVARPYVRKA